MTKKKSHVHWMRHALDLAAKGRYRTSPNPLVGACVVKGERLISEGYHRVYGGDHAEIIALKRAGRRARGATLYVTLEPCSSWGKTPPCVQAVLDAGIDQVVVGVSDPNPVNHGRGIRALRRAGLKVITGVLNREGRKLNAPFFKLMNTGYPYVTVKMAQSLDGKIATSQGNSRWITSAKSRDWVHQLRSECDAILVGKKTFFKDDPLLSPRAWQRRTQPGKPWRVVMDPECELSAKARVFKGRQWTLVAVSQRRLKKKLPLINGKTRRTPLVFLPVPETKKRLDVRVLLKQLGNLGAAKLLVEGGGELVWSLLEARLVDRMLLFTAPKIMGGKKAKTSVEGKGVSHPAKAFEFRHVESRKIGEDYLFEGTF